MPSEPIREVTVLGAGVMGAAIAAHLANAGVRVRLLDIPAKDAPAGAHVVKAFNTVPSDVLAAGSAEGRPLDVFIAGDDAEAKVSVSAFVESLGMRPLDTGPLAMARALEHATLLHLGLVAHSVKHTNFFLGVNILS